MPSNFSCATGLAAIASLLSISTASLSESTLRLEMDGARIEGRVSAARNTDFLAKYRQSGSPRVVVFWNRDLSAETQDGQTTSISGQVREQTHYAPTVTTSSCPCGSRSRAPANRKKTAGSREITIPSLNWLSWTACARAACAWSTEMSPCGWYTKRSGTPTSRVASCSRWTHWSPTPRCSWRWMSLAIRAFRVLGNFMSG